MKKILILLALVAAICISAFAEDNTSTFIEDGMFRYRVIGTDSLQLAATIGEPEDGLVVVYHLVTIDSHKYKVVSIGSNAFSNVRVDSLILSNRIPKLESTALAGCNFKNFRIPTAVDSLPPQVFENCRQLRTIYLHNNLKVMEQGVFSGCDSLENIVCNAETSPRIKGNLFDHDNQDKYNNCNVRVPLRDKYMDADGWKDFGSIDTLHLTERTFIDGGLMFRMLSKDCVELMGIVYNSNWYDSSVSLRTYPRDPLLKNNLPEITRVGDRAFQDFDDMLYFMTAHIIESFGKDVFANNSRLEIIAFMNSLQTPPTIEREPFVDERMREECRVSVVKPMIEPFRQAPGWREFKDISDAFVGYDVIPLDNTAMKEILDIYGRQVKQIPEDAADIESYDLPAGLYIIKTVYSDGSSSSKKVIVR